MKKIARLLLLVMMAGALVAAGSCRTTRTVVRPRPHRVIVHKQVAPPGQVKKITGEKSAKAYAPGQNKNKNKDKKK